MLGLLEKMTLSHQSLGPDDVRAVIAKGVSKPAIGEALEVAFLFNIYDRLADTLGWELPDASYYLKAGQRLLNHGYA